MGFVADFEMIFRLLMASVLGALIGLEREIHGRPAGFRTHLLVSLGSCLFVITSIYFYRVYGNFTGSGPVGVDPGRVAAQVVTGIGFLGAGAIIREKASIRGLTTAACLWVVAAIGVSCGVGLYGISLVVTAISLASLLFLKKVETILKRDTYTSLKVWSEDISGQIGILEDRIRKCGMHMLDASVELDKVNRTVFVEFQIKYNNRNMSCNIVDSMLAVEGVTRVRID